MVNQVNKHKYTTAEGNNTKYTFILELYKVFYAKLFLIIPKFSQK